MDDLHIWLTIVFIGAAVEAVLLWALWLSWGLAVPVRDKIGFTVIFAVVGLLAVGWPGLLFMVK